MRLKNSRGGVGKSLRLWGALRSYGVEMLIETIRATSSDYPEFDLGDLTAFAVQSRYPDELVEPDAAEVKRYAELAEKVRADVRHRIGLQDSE